MFKAVKQKKKWMLTCFTCMLGFLFFNNWYPRHTSHVEGLWCWG